MKSQNDNIVALPWGNEVINPVRNTNQTYLKFVNTLGFSEDGRRFLRYGYYTDAPKGTLDYDKYWEEQEKRCLNGYTIGGVRITGRQYFFLNFCPIKARPININTGLEDLNARKRWTLPRFLDHSYYFFHELEECLAEGPHIGRPRQGMCILKSRRKGFTYQISGGGYAYNFEFVPHSMNMLAAFEKTHYKVTLDGIHSALNHMNKNTPWIRRREVLNQRDHFRASFKEKDAQNVEVEDGYLSEVHAISFKDNPFKSIGESLDIAGFEEAGKFTGLLEALAITEPTYRDGDIMTGVPLVWGTGGDIEAGGIALESFFYNPKAYGFKGYNNIYDDNATGECGWFVDDLWYLPGKTLIGGKETDMVDNQGNSIRSAAYESLMKKRDDKKKGDPRAYKTFITQQPLTPKEALMRTDGDFFDVIAAQDRLSQIETNPAIYLNTIFIGRLHVNEANKIEWRPSDDSPVREFPMRDNKNKPGAIEIYEHPVRNERGEIPSGLYIAGIDPYDDDESTTDSLGSTLIMNIATDRIVAEYTGRPPTAYQYYENVRRLLMYYNAMAMYENAKKGLYVYFERMNSTYLLADTPKFLKDMELVKGGGTGNSSKGYFPSQQVNAFGRGLIRNWSQQLAHGHDDGVTNMLVIRSWGLLKELANYNSKGNFDRVSAAIALMLIREEKARYLTPGLMEQKQNLKREDKFFSRNYGNKNPFGGILFGNRH